MYVFITHSKCIERHFMAFIQLERNASVTSVGPGGKS